MILSVNNAAFEYNKGKTVFENLSLDVKSGEILAILGANGAGKTTLLRCIMGFLRFTRGQALLDGENIALLPSKSSGRRSHTFRSREECIPRSTSAI